jgi:hypothetical protein
MELKMKFVQRRIVDNVLVSWVDDAPNLPISVPPTTPAHCGGSIEDYEVVEVTDEQASAIMANIPAKSTLINGVVAARTLPQITSDKAQIQSDGTDTATITLTAESLTHAGKVWWTVRFPEGNESRVEDVFTAGIATLTLTTEQDGTHEVIADSLDYGQVTLEIEGV